LQFLRSQELALGTAWEGFLQPDRRFPAALAGSRVYARAMEM
jgi:hypothetical protein